MARIEINLLPRELRGRGRGIGFDKNVVYVAGIALILGVLFVGVSVFQSIRLKELDKKIAEAQRKTEQLRKKIELVDALTELKDKLLERMSAIEALDRNRAVWVRVLEDLSRRVPDYLWLSLLREEESEASSSPPADTTTEAVSIPPRFPVKKVTIEGYSYSLNSLASFLIQLMRSQYFKNMELQYVKRAQIKDYKTFSFQLVGDLHYQPEFESPTADTAIHELVEKDTEMKLAAGRE